MLKIKLTEQSGTPLPPGGLIILVTRRFELDTSRVQRFLAAIVAG